MIGWISDTYWEVLRLAPKDSDDPCFWMGEAGFFLPRDGQSPENWILELLSRRWPAMHPDLVPFAVDASGNRYCFHVPGVRRGRRAAVVCWMYETYFALPVASSFDTFLDWIGLTTAWVARQGIDPVLDVGHLETVVEPMARALGRPGAYATYFHHPESTLTHLHRAMLHLDRYAAGSLTWESRRVWEDGWGQPGAQHARAALQAFPECAAAHLVLARYGNVGSAGSVRAEALAQVLRTPLVYAGDPAMRHFGGLEGLHPAGIAERIADLPEALDLLEDDPLLELVLREDPQQPDAWLRVAFRWLEREAMRPAIHAASNALLLGQSSPLLPDTLAFLAELYEAAGWTWHEQLIARDLERLSATRARSSETRHP